MCELNFEEKEEEKDDLLPHFSICFESWYLFTIYLIYFVDAGLSLINIFCTLIVVLWSGV